MDQPFCPLPAVEEMPGPNPHHWVMHNDPNPLDSRRLQSSMGTWSDNDAASVTKHQQF